MSMVICVRNNFAKAIMDKCYEKGCKLKLDRKRKEVKRYVILKGEKISKKGKICDCIIFMESKGAIVIGIVELKNKVVHINEIKEKLTNGSKILSNILKRCNSYHTNFEIFHIVLAKRWQSSEYRILSKEKIKVNGKKYNIILKKCGVSFFRIISSFK